MMRLLVSGGSGQLGKDLARLDRSDVEVVALDRMDLDITDLASVRMRINEVQPDVFVNCAAWTAVDACEADPELAGLVNGDAVRVLRQECERSNTHLIQVSTDYVFDGSKPTPYRESDRPNPASVYGRSKFLGEINAGPDASIVRTSWVFSEHGGNMVATICRLADQNELLQFVDDQIGNPTYSRDLAEAIANIAFSRESGVWHCTNSGAVSWFEFARAVLAARGDDPQRVRPIPTKDLRPPRPAARPANSVLLNERYNEQFGKLRDFRETLWEVVAAQS